jgi:hypothetical protein
VLKLPGNTIEGTPQVGTTEVLHSGVSCDPHQRGSNVIHGLPFTINAVVMYSNCRRQVPGSLLRRGNDLPAVPARAGGLRAARLPDGLTWLAVWFAPMEFA